MKYETKLICYKCSKHKLPLPGHRTIGTCEVCGEEMTSVESVDVLIIEMISSDEKFMEPVDLGLKWEYADISESFFADKKPKPKEAKMRLPKWVQRAVKIIAENEVKEKMHLHDKFHKHVEDMKRGGVVDELIGNRDFDEFAESLFQKIFIKKIPKLLYTMLTGKQTDETDGALYTAYDSAALKGSFNVLMDNLKKDILTGMGEEFHNRVGAYIESEVFLDRMVERLNKKQLKK